jgi:hypothetical protein
VRIETCAICGKEKTSGNWFLLTENRWEDKLSILEWHEVLSRVSGVHRACCTAHVRELVVHWMTTGSLNYPFAADSAPNSILGIPRSIWAPKLEVCINQARLIGEITVDRESIGRLLAESSCCLTSMLAVLDSALRHEPLPALPFGSPSTPFRVAQPEL